MKYMIYWSCVVLFVGGVVLPSFGVSYYEDRYYCSVQNGRMVVSTSRDAADFSLCLSMIQVLHTNMAQYVSQLTEARTNLSHIQGLDPEMEKYWNGYISSLQRKVLQSRVLHTQIVNTMNKFESDLYKTTMEYIVTTYTPVLESIERSIARREESLLGMIKIGNVGAVSRINSLLLVDRRKHSLIVSMFQSTNFNELMPFYTAYQKGSFEF